MVLDREQCTDCCCPSPQAMAPEAPARPWPQGRWAAKHTCLAVPAFRPGTQAGNMHALHPPAVFTAPWLLPSEASPDRQRGSSSSLILQPAWSLSGESNVHSRVSALGLLAWGRQLNASTQPAPAAACTFLRWIRASRLAAAAAGWFLQGDHVHCLSVAKTEANQRRCLALRAAATSAGLTWMAPCQQHGAG